MALPKKQLKDSEQRKILSKIFDDLALKDLFKLKSKGIYDTYKGIINEGKESRVLLVYKGDEPRIIKIYKIEAGNFKNILKYLEGDERFRSVRGNRRAIMYLWAKKEFANLEIVSRLGLNVPEPYAYVHNIVAMGFIGTKDGVVAPQLRHAHIEHPQSVFENIIHQIKIMVRDGKLVHGDLSEYNILIHNYKPYIIDFAQAVKLNHPRAKEFFEHDINQIVSFFNKRYELGIDAKKIMYDVGKGIFYD